MNEKQLGVFDRTKRKLYKINIKLFEGISHALKLSKLHFKQFHFKIYSYFYYIQKVTNRVRKKVESQVC